MREERRERERGRKRERKQEKERERRKGETGNTYADPTGLVHNLEPRGRERVRGERGTDETDEGGTEMREHRGGKMRDLQTKPKTSRADKPMRPNIGTNKTPAPLRP